ncbi:glycoside hydrolase superfamily [Tribonema minus]|uniref:Glycoside hydrolase superfamily n=1 Tax=Tribonema minus TaxID=303371 RepID=A0A836CMW1_9STRA|nr:glycoside hydrolase superfamily [Tribonema minus]
MADLKWDFVASKIDAYGQVQLVIDFIDQEAHLKKIASGAYDSKLRAVGKDAAKDGRQIYVRMLHEMNGDWYNWRAFFGDNTVGDFKNAYKHAVTVLRSMGANLKFQMSYVANNASKKKTPFKDFYVGDEYVDQVCTSAYNQCGATYPKNKFLEDVFGDFYTEVQTFTKRPICIAEMSSTGCICKGKPAWITLGCPLVT